MRIATLATAAALTVSMSSSFALSNVALTGSATQSSTFNSQAVAGAQKAIDGNTDGTFSFDPVTNSVSHTLQDASLPVGNGFSWWEVALGVPFNVDSSPVWNRTDSFGFRLSDFTATLLSNNVPVWTEVYSDPAGPAPSVSFTGIGAAGDTVRIQLNRQDFLQLAAVQVMATPVPEPTALMLMLAGLGVTAVAARSANYERQDLCSLSNQISRILAPGLGAGLDRPLH